MAKTESINVLLDPSGKMVLNEAYGVLTDRFASASISNFLKNKNYSGDMSSGSVVIKKFQNGTVATYGTASTNGYGTALKGTEVTINLSNRKEIVDQVEQADISEMGLQELVNKRADSNSKTMEIDLDKAFFSTAYSTGTETDSSSTDIKDIVEDMIVEVESVENSYYNGIDREFISIVLTPALYGELRTYIDTTNTANVTIGEDVIPTYHGCKIFKSTRLPEGVDAIVMMDESVAQPLYVNDYTAEKVPYRDAIALELFYNYGTGNIYGSEVIRYYTPS